MRQVVRCFLQDNDKILLVKHNENTLWTLPGGHVEDGESIFDAIEREIKEEFNLKIKLTNDNKYLNYSHIKEFSKPLSIYTISYNSPKHGVVTKLEYIFLAKVVSGELKVQEEEIYDYKWFTRDEINNNSSHIYSQILDLLNLF
ncbi:MAG: NUDIX hydrolase [Candidatus Gracilibacteria bacterium]|nr:NUDIX hydrolase [Candidatus Gracilibacteria bacterium]